MKKISTKFLKISQGRVEVDKELPVGTYDVEVLVKGDIIQEIFGDSQDGTVDVIYVLKAYEIKIVEK